MDTPQQNSSGRTILLVVIVLAILGAGGYFLYQWLQNPAATTGELDETVEAPEITSLSQVAAYTGGKPLPSPSDKLFPPFNEHDHIRGEAAADLSIVEYSNFGNPYAALLHTELQKIVSENPGTVNWVYRHYSVGPQDLLPSKAAECVYFGEGHPGFWTYFDSTFSIRQPTADLLATDAMAAGADRTQYTKCMDENWTQDRAITDAQNASIDLGIDVAPTYVFFRKSDAQVRIVEGLNTAEYMRAVVADMQ